MARWIAPGTTRLVPLIATRGIYASSMDNPLRRRIHLGCVEFSGNTIALFPVHGMIAAMNSENPYSMAGETVLITGGDLASREGPPDLSRRSLDEGGSTSASPNYARTASLTASGMRLGRPDSRLMKTQLVSPRARRVSSLRNS